MTRTYAEILLICLIAARSTSYLFSKLLLDSMEPFTLIAVRFLLAFAILCVIFRRKLIRAGRETVKAGFALGALFFATMSFETLGLVSVSSSSVSFLQNTAIIFVPVIEAVLLRKRPAAAIMISAVTALAGVAFLTIKDGGFVLKTGELLCIASAVSYAVTIIATDRLSKRYDAALLGVLQIGFIGFFGLIAAFILETPRLPSTGTEWADMLMLVIVCSVFGFTLQPVAQRYTSAQTAGLYCALNPLIACALGVLVLHEAFNMNILIGGALIVCSMIISKIADRPYAARRGGKNSGAGKAGIAGRTAGI